MGTIVGLQNEEDAKSLNDFWAGEKGDPRSTVKEVGAIEFPKGLKRGLPMSLNQAITDGGKPLW